MHLLALFFLLAAAFTCAKADPAPRVDARLFNDGLYEKQKVTLVGCVKDICPDTADGGFIFIILDCDGTVIYAVLGISTANTVINHLQQLVDCRVSISGVSAHVEQLYNRKSMRQQLSIASTNDIRVISRSESNPFDVPNLDQAPPQLQDLDRCGPRKVRGLVTARWQKNTILVLQPRGESVTVQLRDDYLPDLGATIDAVGLPDSDLYRLNLVRGQWHPVNLPDIKFKPALNVTLKSLFNRDSYTIVNPSVHGHTLKLKGTLKSFLTDETGVRNLLIGDDGYAIRIDCSQIQEALSRIEEGSLLEVTGVCVHDCESWRPNNLLPKVKGLFLVARTADDIRVLQRPPWLTPLRFVLILTSLLVVIVLILVWNATLRILVRRRSREVIRAQEKKLESELRVGERTRLAAELHDYLAQNLTALAYQVSAIQKTIAGKDPETSRDLNSAAQMLDSCRVDLRRCLWDLKSDVLDEPDFTVAIRKTVQPVAAKTKVGVRFAGHRSRISDSTAHTILSILRELVANAVNHGHAQNVRIAGEERPDVLRFSVRDDGCGFDLSARLNSDGGHFGIDGIRERLRHLNGTLKIESVLGSGTRIRVTISKTSMCQN